MPLSCGVKLRTVYKVIFMFRRLLALVFLFAAGAAWAQRILTTPDLSAMTARDGVGEVQVRKVISLPDGGMIVVGKFDVWYEGQRFRDLLKLKASGEPDMSWRVDISYLAGRPGELYDAALTPTGLFIAATDVEMINGSAPPPVPYVSVATGRLINAPSAAPVNAGYLMSNYDSATGYVYFENGGVLHRVSGTTGNVDSRWRAVRQFAAVGGALVADAKGGLWQGYCDSSFMITTCGVQRHVLNDALPEAGAALPLSLQFSISVPIGQTRVTAARAHAFAGFSRFGAGGIQDTGWQTPGSPAFVTDKYAYFANAKDVSRAPLSGNGTPDSWRVTAPASYLLAEGPPIYVSWTIPGEDDGIAVLAYTGPCSVVNTGGCTQSRQFAFMVKGDPAGNEDQSVVEYFVPALKRYFITGRKAEQDALDALPQSFQRTGMKFTAKSSRYRDVPEQPVCRLYASPDKGMSNSHFYGIGDDCPTLNKLSGLKYEGYDFSVIKPYGSVCTGEAANPVWRLFNNKAATNEGNHRYVVSVATKARMVSQGWVDEGVVFCSTGVTDAAN